MSTTTPKEVLNQLKKGNTRFIAGKRKKRILIDELRQASEKQTPSVIVLSCSDSRVAAEHLFDQGINYIFNIRIAGNVLNDDIIGSIEYACKYLNIHLLVVLGHTKCEAVGSACRYVKLGNVTGLVNKIVPAIIAIESEEKYLGDSEEFYDAISKKNVELTVKNIARQSYILNEMILNNNLLVVGSVYDINTGKVEFLSNNP